MSANTPKLNDFLGAIADGSIKMVDLTETLRPDYPTIQLPEEFGQAWAFKKEEISKYDDRGPMWTWSNFSMSEHTGTHLDAPNHWVSGKDIANGTVDTMPLTSMVAPAVVVDCSKEVAADLGFILTDEFLENWKNENNPNIAGSWLLFRSDWRHTADPGNYTNMQEDGSHSPGPDPSAVRWMIENDALGFGTECIGTDAGQAFNFDPPYPCHHLMHGDGRLGLQCLTNLDLLPTSGAVLLTPPLKIIEGSGSPLRVVALIEG